MTPTKTDKPLKRKAYGSIGHLPGSRMGPADHKCPDGYYDICCKKLRDKHDRIVIQEKLDGSCVAVAKLDGELIPLQRAGYPAISSPFEQHHLFHHWVMDNAARFDSVLWEGQRLVGEWLAQAHGTRYDLTSREPFVAFDIMRESKRMPYQKFMDHVFTLFSTPTLIAEYPATPEECLEVVGSGYGALDPVEGVVYRVEKHQPGKCWRVDFLAKYVRPDKVDGLYLPEVSGKEAVWNWGK